MIKAVIARLNENRARRARHLALIELLTMDAHRLDDLGISIADVMLAIEDRRRPLKPIENSAGQHVTTQRHEAGTLLRT